MPTDFNKNASASKGGFKPASADTPLDIRTRVETEADIMSIPRPYVGMVVYVKDTGKRFEIISLKDIKSGMTTIKDGAVNEYRELTSANEIEDKINEILMDPTSSEDNERLWENLKVLMEQPTLIEGMQRILEGKQQDKVLGITPDDIGKILSVAQAEDGEMMVKAIDNILNADKVEYTNDSEPEISTVESALDKLFEMQGDGSLIDGLMWDQIMNPPRIATGLELTNNALVMNDEDGEMSSVPLMTNEDVDELLNELE